MLRIRPYLLLIGFVATLIAAICPSSSAHASVPKLKNSEWKAEEARLEYSVPVSMPVGDDPSSDYPVIKADGSYNQAQTPICVRANHNLYCLFEISKSEIQFDESPPQVNVALNRFYATLFDAIISPNAP